MQMQWKNKYKNERKYTNGSQVPGVQLELMINCENKQMK